MKIQMILCYDLLAFTLKNNKIDYITIYNNNKKVIFHYNKIIHNSNKYINIIGLQLFRKKWKKSYVPYF